MKTLKSVLFICIFFLSLQSCQKDNSDVNDPYADQEAPALPDIASFAISFEDFSQVSSRREVSPRTIDHFSHAVANVVTWNLLLTVNLVIPIAVLDEAFHHDPVYQGNGIWLWTYDVTDDQGVTYQAEFSAQLVPSQDEVKWDMYISLVGNFDRVHWFTGVTAFDESYSHWTLNHQPGQPESFMKIDYDNDLSQDLETIRFTNIIPNSDRQGSYIEYRETTRSTPEYDRGYDIYDVKTII